MPLLLSSEEVNSCIECGLLTSDNVKFQEFISNNALESSLSKVYNELRRLGYFVTTHSAKFGADFLAYPGDPFRFHAHYTVTVERGPMSCLELASMARIAVSTKKSTVLASVKKDERGESKVSFLTIEWRA